MHNTSRLEWTRSRHGYCSEKCTLFIKPLHKYEKEGDKDGEKDGKKDTMLRSLLQVTHLFQTIEKRMKATLYECRNRPTCDILATIALPAINWSIRTCRHCCTADRSACLLIIQQSSNIDKCYETYPLNITICRVYYEYNINNITRLIAASLRINNVITGLYIPFVVDLSSSDPDFNFHQLIPAACVVVHLVH